MFLYQLKLIVIVYRPYANRIKNGSFIIDGVTYNVDKNEHGGLNTLHGGKTGYDSRNWTAVALGANCVKYSLYDPAGTGGFPGPVVSTHSWLHPSPPPPPLSPLFSSSSSSIVII